MSDVPLLIVYNCVFAIVDISNVASAFNTATPLFPVAANATPTALFQHDIVTNFPSGLLDVIPSQKY